MPTVEKTVTCKFDVKLVLRFEYLDVEGAVGSKVLHRPGSQDGLVVLARKNTYKPHFSPPFSIFLQNREKSA